jgi:hypothetical protein
LGCLLVFSVIIFCMKIRLLERTFRVIQAVGVFTGIMVVKVIILHIN